MDKQENHKSIDYKKIVRAWDSFLVMHYIWETLTAEELLLMKMAYFDKDFRSLRRNRMKAKKVKNKWRPVLGRHLSHVGSILRRTSHAPIGLFRGQ